MNVTFQESWQEKISGVEITGENQGVSFWD